MGVLLQKVQPVVHVPALVMGFISGYILTFPDVKMLQTYPFTLSSAYNQMRHHFQLIFIGVFGMSVATSKKVLEGLSTKRQMSCFSLAVENGLDISLY